MRVLRWLGWLPVEKSICLFWTRDEQNRVFLFPWHFSKNQEISVQFHHFAKMHWSISHIGGPRRISSDSGGQWRRALYICDHASKTSFLYTCLHWWSIKRNIPPLPWWSVGRVMSPYTDVQLEGEDLPSLVFRGRKYALIYWCSGARRMPSYINDHLDKGWPLALTVIKRIKDIKKKNVQPSPYTPSLLSQSLSQNEAGQTLWLNEKPIGTDSVQFIHIHIHDIKVSINSLISVFADDTKIGRAKTSHQDIETLQEDLNEIMRWTTTWQMRFNHFPPAVKTNYGDGCLSFW